MKPIPRLRLAHLPTVVEPMPRLSTALGGPQLWIKRDDQTGLAMGGNKVRKLEFLLAEAQAHGARRLITAGASQSNHCRQTAAAAARCGFECTLVLSSPTASESNQPLPTHATGNLLLDRLFGAQLVWAEPDERDRTLNETFQAAWDAGQRPYLIPVGGSTPTGATGYVFAMQELMEQEIKPDWIVFSSASGGTHAGLVLGARLYGFQGKVLGISIDMLEDELQAIVAQLASETADFLGENQVFTPEEILVNASYLGEGYSEMGEAESEAIRLFARYEGLLLDPVYTGRAAAGLVDLVRRGFFSRDQVVLFWHTGGTPALFADRYAGLAG